MFMLFITWTGTGTVTAEFQSTQMTAKERLGTLAPGTTEKPARIIREVTAEGGGWVQFQVGSATTADQEKARLGVSMTPMGNITS